jgi:hypothetical protein
MGPTLLAADLPVLDSPSPAYQTEGLTMAPLRPVLEWLGASQAWQADRQTLTFSGGRPQRSVTLAVGSAHAVAGDDLLLPKPPHLAHGVLYAPLRAVLQPLEVSVTWQAEPRGVVLAQGDRRAFLPVMASAFPLVGGYGLLVGGHRNGRWADADQMAPALTGGEAYWLYTLDKALPDRLTGGAPTVEEPGEYQSVELAVPEPLRHTAFAFAGPWDAMPRAPVVLGNTVAAYQAQVRRLLDQHGLKASPVVIHQALRCDLEGDGKDEVLIAAASLARLSPDSTAPAPRAQPGNYQVVLLRKLAGQEVKTFVLTQDWYGADADQQVPTIDRVGAVLDLDGDGAQEIVLTWEYYEGYGVQVFQLQGGVPKPVLSAGLGA